MANSIKEGNAESSRAIKASNTAQDVQINAANDAQDVKIDVLTSAQASNAGKFCKSTVTSVPPFTGPSVGENVSTLESSKTISAGSMQYDCEHWTLGLRQPTFMHSIVGSFSIWKLAIKPEVWQYCS